MTNYQFFRTNEYVYGMIRALNDPDTKFNNDLHKNEYSKLAHFVIDFVQKQMKNTFKLREVMIPENRHIPRKYHSLPKCNIFMSADFYHPKPDLSTNRNALVLIQGTGAVRAGIWARSVCINENLGLGSMLPFIDVCQNKDIPVLVMNPNYACDPETKITVPHSQTMADHAAFVWEHYVIPSGFNQISIVAHSAGGSCVSEIQRKFKDSFYKQVVNIAYTDSWVIDRKQLSEPQRKFMFRNAVHYVASEKPLGTILGANAKFDTCPSVSAGHSRHEYTTGVAMPEILAQFGYDI